MSDYNHHHIQIFTSEGQFLFQFCSKGSGPGKLAHLFGIVVDNNNLMYITECGNNHISIFTTDCQFVQSFGGQGSSVGQF